MTLDLLKVALTRAQQCKPADDGQDGPKHRERSKNWVECLGQSLRDSLKANSSVRVFTKHEPSNREAFGLNELLYDVCVVETGECSSLTGRKLQYVTRAVWLIESEFARDSGAAVKDFNKLVLGAAENKLFIGPRLSSDGDDQRFRDALIPVARQCVNDASPNVFLAQVTHPDSWDTGTPPTATLWKLLGSSWEVVHGKDVCAT